MTTTNGRPTAKDNGTNDATILDRFSPASRTIKEPHNLSPHPQTGRLIDSHPGARSKPMKVLCLGMSRTGTMTLFTAMQQLGYTPYHMAVALGAPKMNFNLWCEAMTAKFHNDGSGSPLMKQWGREEFDKLLGNYDAVADVPAILFSEELINAYPEVKIVLQTRDVRKWVESLELTIGIVARWRGWVTIASWDDGLVGPWWKFIGMTMPRFGGKGLPPSVDQFNNDSQESAPVRKAFEDHYELVRRVTPKERLLEYKVQDGWGPLVEFLGVQKPEGSGEKLPWVNDSEQFVKFHAVLWWVGFGKMVGKMAMMGAVPVAIGGAAVAYQRFGSLQGVVDAVKGIWT